MQKKSKVEGEGSYTASRRYREGLAKSVAKGESERLGREAQKAYDGPEGKTLREAEERGKSRARKVGRVRKARRPAARA